MKRNLMWALGLFFSCQNYTDSQIINRLWDHETPIHEIAKSCSITNLISESNPQPMGMSESDGTPNLSNPEMTISLWGPTDQLTLSINKNDVWDRRKAWEQPVTLEALRAGYFSPVNKDNSGRKGFMTPFYPTPEGEWVDPYAAWRIYPFPCMKPVGQVTVLADDFKSSIQPKAVTHLQNGLTEVNLSHQKAKANLQYLIMMEENVMAIKGNFRNLDKPLKLRISRHKDTYDPKHILSQISPLYKDYDLEADSLWNQPLDPPESGRDGKYFWIRQKMPAEKTFPNGFEYMLVGLIEGEDYTIETIENGKHMRTQPTSDGHLANYSKEGGFLGAAAIATLNRSNNHEFTVFTTVVTTNDADDLLNEAKTRLRSAKERKMDHLISQNEAWYTSLYNKRESGRIFTGDSADEKRVMPGLFYSWIFDHSMSCPDPTQFEAQAKGYSFLEIDAPRWHSLPCYNELFMSTPLSVQNRSDLLSYYVKLIGMWHSAARDNAKEVFDLPGLYVGHGYLPPIKPDKYPHSHVVYEMSMDMPAQLIKYIWDVWEYNGDVNFLKEEVYPVIRDLANFYAAYLTKEKDGSYHIVPTIPQERWTFNYQFEYNRDAMTSIAMFKWVFKKATEAAKLIDEDEDLQKEWIALICRLQYYPQLMTENGPIWIPVEGDPLHEDESISCLAKLSGLMFPVTLTNEVNLDSDPEEIELALRSARFHDKVVWDKTMVFHLLGAAKNKLYRYAGTTARWVYQQMLHNMKKDHDGYILLDTYEDHVNASWLEPERLLNSRSGRIHLFPCVVDEFTIGFKHLMASGGFDVSAELISGRVTFLEIESRRSIICQIVNPWSTKEIKVINKETNEEIEFSFDDHRKQGIAFMAQAGDAYSIFPIN